jgi:WD repeat-containing protein 55
LAFSHPHSVEALCALPSLIPNVDSSSTILTGSSDGLVRAVKVLPTKLLGVVVDHGELPVERVAIGGGTRQLTLERVGGKDERNVTKDQRREENEDREQNEGDGKWWVGSIGHDEVLRMTDLGDFFREDKGDGNAEAGSSLSRVGDDDDERISNETEGNTNLGVDANKDSRNSPQAKKRKRKPEKNNLAVGGKKGRNTLEVDRMFFEDL